MADDKTVRDLYSIGAARENHGLVEQLLDLVAASADEPVLVGSLGQADINYGRLRLAAEKLGLVAVDEVRAIAGDKAADGLAAFKDAIAPLYESYGLTAGPDRTIPQAERAQAAMVRAAVSAKDGLMRYWREVGGMETPGVEGYMEATRSLSEGRKAALAAARPVSTVPSVPLIRPGEETARLTRILAGHAYGVATLAHVRLVNDEGKHASMIALGAFSGLSGWTGGMASRIERRCRHEDAAYKGVVAGVIDDIDAAIEILEGPHARDAPPVDLAAMRGATFEAFRSLAGRVRQAEALNARLGYEVGEPEAASSAPAP